MDFLAPPSDAAAKLVRMTEFQPDLKPRDIDVPNGLPETPPLAAYADDAALVPDEGVPERAARPGRLIKSGVEFLEGFTPPDYLWDGLLQRRFCYSLTAQTGVGKTAVALLLSLHVGRGALLAGREVQQGRVLYFAGENPDDVRMRWLAMAEHMSFDPATLPVHFVDGRHDLDAIEDRVRAEVAEGGPLTLAVFDTRAAFFHGSDENDNVEAAGEARRFRRFTTFPGGPTILVPCHPVKNAAPDNLLPRGGGAFVNEVDGNLTLAAGATGIFMHWQGKFRGPGFDPMSFELQTVTADRLRDSRGRLIPTVMAKCLSEDERRARASEHRRTEDQVLLHLLEAGGETPSMASIATGLGWLTPNGQPLKSKVSRAIDALLGEKLVTKERGAAVLTEKGRKAAQKAQYNRDAAGGKYS